MRNTERSAASGSTSYQHSAQPDIDPALIAAIVISSDDAIVSKDLNGNITTWNEAAVRLFGYTAAEAVGQHVSLIADPGRDDESAHILSRIRTGERIEHYETVRRRKDGTKLHVSLTVSPVRNAAGEIVGASKIARDITARKRIEEALQAQTRILEMIASGAPLSDVLNVLCEAAEHQLPGAACCILLLRPHAERLHLAAAPHLAEWYLEALRQGIPMGPAAGTCGTAVHGRDSVAVVDIATDGLCADWKDLALSAGLRACWSRSILSDTGEVLGTFSTYLPVVRAPGDDEVRAINGWLHLASIAVRRLQSLEALAISEERLRLAQEAADIGTWSLDILEPAANYWSANAYRIAGMDTSWHPAYDEWLARVHPDDREKVNGEIQAALTGGRAFGVVYRFQGDDGIERWHEARGSVRRDAAGNPIGANGITLDITERKRAEEALRDSEQNRKLITDSLPVLISYVDADERYRFNNRTYESWFGRKAGEVEGRTVREVMGENAYGNSRGTSTQRSPANRRALRLRCLIRTGAPGTCRLLMSRTSATTG